MIRDRISRASSAGQIKFAAALLGSTAIALVATPAWAQDAAQDSSAAASDDAEGDAIVVTGIRNSLMSALTEKRTSDNLVEVIQAEDIGKLPDQNLAEVLENVTGVQITRQAGVGNAVQIRGTDANRTDINGVSTRGSGASTGWRACTSRRTCTTMIAPRPCSRASTCAAKASSRSTWRA